MSTAVTEPVTSTRQPMLIARGLVKHFGRVTALNGSDLDFGG